MNRPLRKGVVADFLATSSLREPAYGPWADGRMGGWAYGPGAYALGRMVVQERMVQGGAYGLGRMAVQERMVPGGVWSEAYIYGSVLAPVTPGILASNVALGLGLGRAIAPAHATFLAHPPPIAPPPALAAAGVVAPAPSLVATLAAALIAALVAALVAAVPPLVCTTMVLRLGVLQQLVGWRRECRRDIHYS